MHIEPGLLVIMREIIAEALPGRRLALIADQTVNRLYDEWTSGTVEARRLGARASDAGLRLQPATRLTFPAGERSKNRETWQRLTDELLAAKLGRDTAIVALGGGVTGDLAGFVAATFLRGVPYVQVPTTLLAMVDSSVGGKVGVDTALGKNLVGAFYQPMLVLADPLTLMSLPEQQYRGGIAEAIKHGLIADREYFEWITSHERDLRSRQPDAISHLVQRSVEIKAGIVARDEREHGQRAVLNAGHTIAHAVEQVSSYQVPHGDAVAMGLVTECRIAETMGFAEEGLATQVGRLLERFGLPVAIPSQLGTEALMDAMALDKKNTPGALRFALASGVGRTASDGSKWTTVVSAQTVKNALQFSPLNKST
ncbi:MAG: 3-dehydroquinate synthase [Gemmatimonadota bacterium]